MDRISIELLLKREEKRCNSEGDHSDWKTYSGLIASDRFPMSLHLLERNHQHFLLGVPASNDLGGGRDRIDHNLCLRFHRHFQLRLRHHSRIHFHTPRLRLHRRHRNYSIHRTRHSPMVRRIHLHLASARPDPLVKTFSSSFYFTLSLISLSSFPSTIDYFQCSLLRVDWLALLNWSKISLFLFFLY